MTMPARTRTLTGCMKASRSRRGQAAVEFALAVTCFLMLIFGIMQFGRALYGFSFVDYAAREATRYAAVHGADSPSPAGASDVTNFVVSEAHGIAPSALSVTTSWPAGNNKPGSSVSVTVTYSFPLAIPFLPAQTLPLTSTSQLVISQ
jgi:Flp pilus assembly protein TadG